MQKAVAKNMEKTMSVPIFRVSREIVTDKFDDLYALLKPKGVTVSAMLAKAVAEVLKKVKL
jgi:pyruvate dehydrogenase E2 component (dihydrolipoamide acetyltransferase)